MLCSLDGIECYKKLRPDTDNCVAPCKGIYADVQRDIEAMNVENLRKFDKMVESYEHYRRGFIKDIEYPKLLKGGFKIGRKEKLQITFHDLGYKKQKARLHFVQIYFGTPTFDRITKDEKANFETKLSTIGGTMGLLTGFSIISGVEIAYSIAKILISSVQNFCKKRKNMDLNQIKSN